MTNHRAPSPAKWPYFVADIALLAVAFWIVSHYSAPIPVAALALGVACVVVAAFIAVMPFRMEYQAVVRFAESNDLHDVVEQINKTEDAAEQIRTATAQWQGVQEQSARTVATAHEIAERITAEAKAFGEFMQRANDNEKSTLKLEVEKLRRGESQWLQLTVHLLDHVYALHQAGARSGQPNLEAQLGRFREACYEAVRRIGLVPFLSGADEGFDPEKHQVVDGQPEPEAGTLIGQTLAAGYSFQGQLVRRALVALPASESQSQAVTPEPTETPMEETAPEVEEIAESAATLETVESVESAEPAEMTESAESADVPPVDPDTENVPGDEPPPMVRGKMPESDQPFRLES